MKTSLAVKYRPQAVADIIGQPLIVKIFQQMIKTRNFKHCILLAGHTGCGKTTFGRALAYEINGGVGEPIELDCASHGGVEDIRAIVEDANQRSLTGEYKIFILDECHAISTAGWQAALKMIEECPEHTIFIFCTTAPEKIPATILNRVQRYNIAPISTTDIKNRLCYICQCEGFTDYEAGCDFISKISDGSMRTAIAHLEQCADYSPAITIENVKTVLGTFSYEAAIYLTNCLIDGNESEIINTIDKLESQGTDIKQFMSFYLDFCLEALKYILFRNIAATNIPAYLEKPKAQNDTINIQYMTGIENNIAWFKHIIDLMLQVKSEIKYDVSCKNTVEAYLLKICRG